MSWLWGPSQEEAFSLVKAELSKPTTLTLYDTAKDVKISADASSFGLGAVLLQNDNSVWRLVAYASRSMSNTHRVPIRTDREGGTSHHMGIGEVPLLHFGKISCYGD